jgi:hypothetical protein
MVFDAAVLDNWGTGTSLTFTHTTTGSNRFLVVGTAAYSASLVTATAVTYNGVSLTKVNAITAELESNNQETSLWYLDNPASGANDVVVTWSGSVDFGAAASASYTGKTTIGIDAHNTAQNTSTSTNSPACNVNVVKSDCWLVAFGYSRLAGAPTAGTGTTVRQDNGVGHVIGDSNGVVGTGNQSLAFVTGSAVTWPGVVSLSFSEANAGGAVAPTLRTVHSGLRW